MNRIAKKAIATLLAMNVVITAGFDSNLDSSIRVFAADNSVTVEDKSGNQDTVVEGTDKNNSVVEDVVNATTVSSCAITVDELKLKIKAEYNEKYEITSIKDDGDENKNLSITSDKKNLKALVVSGVKKVLNKDTVTAAKDLKIEVAGVKSFATSVDKTSVLDELSKALVQKSENVIFTNGVKIDSKIESVKNVSFNGNISGKGSIGQAETVNINAGTEIEVGENAFNNCTITNLNVGNTNSGKVTLSSKAFEGCTVENAEFSGNIELNANSMYNTTFKKWYLYNVALNYLADSPYNRQQQTEQTNVYIIGGSLVDNGSYKLTVPTLVSNWLAKDYKKNIVSGTPTITYSNNLKACNDYGVDAFATADYKTGSATIDFSKSITVANTLQKDIGNKYDLKQNANLTWTSADSTYTINNYRVWKRSKNSSSMSLSYVDNNTSYTYNAMQSAQETLQTGRYYYLIEANGVLTPITVYVDDVQSLRIVSAVNPSNGNVIYKNTEDYLGIGDFYVYAQYQYSGEVSVSISDVTVPMTKAETPKNGNQYADTSVVIYLTNRNTKKGTIILRGSLKKVISYSVSAKKNAFYKGETIYAKDLDVFNIRYNDLSTAVVADGTKSCSFLVNNQQVSSVVLNNVGENWLNVVYDGVVVSNAIKVVVSDDKVVQMKVVSFNGSAVAGASIKPSDFKVSFTFNSGKIVDVNSAENANYVKDVVLSTNTLVTGKNTITLQYRECQATYTIDAIATTAAPVVSSTPVETLNPSVSNEPVIPNVDSKVTATPTVAPEKTPRIITTPAPVNIGEKYTINGIKYVVTDLSIGYGKVKIVGYDSSVKKITYKNTITISNQKFRVNVIAKNAFKGCSALKGNLNLGNYLTSVGDGAFTNCNNLTGIVFGKKVKSIGKKAFYNCKKMKSVDFKNAKSLKSIGSSAFKKINKSRKFKLKVNIALIIKLMKGKY
ncbi:MAG: leucine-rich repeat protein [Lachnospiraceae bacterium]|nr:leucine-rich repeat protein [Lachnospiraceae bacterium]